MKIKVSNIFQCIGWIGNYKMQMKKGTGILMIHSIFGAVGAHRDSKSRDGEYCQFRQNNGLRIGFPVFFQFLDGADGEIEQTVKVRERVDNGGRKTEIIAGHGDRFDGILDGGVGVGNETTNFVNRKRQWFSRHGSRKNG